MGEQEYFHREGIREDVRTTNIQGYEEALQKN